MACFNFETLLLLILSSGALYTTGKREFRIDYEGNKFLLDGEPFRYVSGSLHYYRVPSFYWRDRLQKYKAAGLNAVQTYVEWSQHEPERGEYRFSGEQDIERFIQLASDEGLLVILRIGPYICAERDLGGFPSWLLTLNPQIKLRTSDPGYLKFVESWIDVLMQRIQPLLYGNGGPIIMVQVENEYGSYPACDFTYTTFLRELFTSYIQNTAVLFTTDGSDDSFLKCGKIEDVYTTVDFGTGENVTKAFRSMRNHQPRGPLVNSEFYPGWLDVWGKPHATVGTEDVVTTLDEMLDSNSSVNIYMFHGGTNFGFTPGADYGSTYTPVTTSYDYDAPLTEAGDPTEKYFAIRDIIGKYLPIPPGPIPQPSLKGNYGSVHLAHAGSLFEAKDILTSNTVYADYPLTFEQLNQAYGFILYETKVTSRLTDPALLSVVDIRDRGYVFVSEVFVGILSRTQKIHSLSVFAKEGQKIQILVENQGRINYGPHLLDFKGLVSNVTLNGIAQRGWTMYQLPFNNPSLLHKYVETLTSINNKGKHNLHSHNKIGPSLYSAKFLLPDSIETPYDTFLDMENWYKGVVFINGYNLGRYWPVVGPQVTLYVPRSFLNSYPTPNKIVVLELEMAPCEGAITCELKFLPYPKLNGSTPVSGTKIYRRSSTSQLPCK